MPGERLAHTLHPQYRHVGRHDVDTTSTQQDREPTAPLRGKLAIDSRTVAQSRVDTDKQSCLGITRLVIVLEGVLPPGMGG